MKRPAWTIYFGIAAFTFMLVPVILVIWMAFFDKAFLSFPPDGYSLKWFVGLAAQRQLFEGLIYSLQIAALTTVCAVVLGVTAAMAISRARLRSRALLESAFTLPLVVPSIIIGVALYIYLYSLGRSTGLTLVPTTWAMVLAHTMITVPWTFRLAYASLAGIGVDLERASMDLGRSPLSTLWRVTLPLLRPAIIGGGIFAFVFSFTELEISLFLIGPRATTLPVAMMQYSEFKIDPTIAAMATVQIVLVGVLMLVMNRFLKIGEVFRGGNKQ